MLMPQLHTARITQITLGLLGEASKDAERVTTRNTNIKTVLNNPGDFAVDAYYERK
mgnify:CR=1 FL=1